MRVLYVCSEFHPAQTAVAVRSRFNVEALEQVGVTVSVLTAGLGGEKPELSNAREVYYIGVKAPDNSKGLVVRLLHEIRMGLSFGFKIAMHRAAFDCVIFTSPPFFAMLVPALICYFRSLPYIFDVRDRYPQVFFSLAILRRESIPGRMLLLLERLLCRGAVMVTTVTSALAKEIEKETGVLPQVVMNGFDAEAITTNQSTRAAGDPKIIFMHGLFGRLFDIKSFVEIVRYCEENAGPHQFVIAGYGPGVQDILDAKLRHISYVGHLSHRDVLQYLGKADYGLSVHTNQPSTNAGFAVKVFEFIGAGIPSIIIPKNESGIEVEKENIGWSFDNTEWLECARLIADLINGRIDTTKIRANLIAKRDRYSRQMQSAQFARLVKELENK